MRAQPLEPQPVDELVFDAVSIKPVTAGRVPLVVGANCVFRGIQWLCPASTLDQLIAMSFRFGDVAVSRPRIVGGPDWMTTSQYEIRAVLNGAVERESFTSRLPGLLRPLLEDRFNLKTHVEPRSLQAYALVRAYEDGRLGPQLRQAATDCPSAPSDLPGRPVPPPVQQTAAEKACFGGSFQAGSISSGAMTMRALASYFTNFGGSDRIVVDRTGLAGNFAIDLRWSPNPLSPAAPAAVPADPTGQPSLFTALREQLGLTLEPRREVMDVLVIDSVTPPTPN